MKKLLFTVFLLALFLLVGCNENEIIPETTAQVGHLHTYSEQYLSATCTECGKVIYICTECGDSYEAIIPATGHSFEHYGAEAATCTKPGHTAYDVCTVCGYSTYCEIPADEGNHSPELLEICTETTDIPCQCRVKCRDCGKEFYTSLTSELLGVPLLKLTGSTDGLSKYDKVTVSADYSDVAKHFKSEATLKIQGASSAGLEKKNYNIKFVKGESANGVTLVDGWGKHSKYCLKANYVDCTHARNIVSGKIYGQIVSSRTLDDEYSALPNGGATDGFPICIYLNGEFLGLYTLNIPKDEWMFGMDDGDNMRMAVLKGADWTDSVSLKKHIAKDFSNGWDLVYCSTENTAWVVNGFNQMMDFVNNNSRQSFKDKLHKVVNVDRAIDAYIYTVFLHANDNISKNIVWTTYDGKVWSPSIYDMDDSWGLVWNGQEYYSPNDWDFSTGTNRLWNKLATEYADEIKARYWELRDEILTLDNISTQFEKFINGIPGVLYAADAEKWQSVPSRDTNNLAQIIKFARQRLKYLDGKMK